MMFRDYQVEAHKTAVYPVVGVQTMEFYPTLGLAGEAGEIANTVKKIYRDDGGRLTTERRNKIIDELGDALWYVAEIASNINCNLDDIAKWNLEKLIERAKENKIRGDGDSR